jgi:chromosome segregation ATPase
MIASCIFDFCISDITRPKARRFKRQMCALINFLRFSEHHIQHFDDLKMDKDKIFSEKEAMAIKVAKLEEEVEREEETRKSQEGATLKLREINARLTNRLQQLQEAQKTMAHQYEDKKKAQSEAKLRCDGLKRDCEALSAEIEKLQMRIDNNPTQLRDMNDNARRRLKEKEQACQEEESKSLIMAQKKKVLEGLEADIATCTQLVKSCLEEQRRLTREQQELDKIRKDRTEMAEERDALTLQLEQSTQKLRFAMERLDKTQRNIETKREESKRKLDSTNERWQEAQKEKKQRLEQAEGLNRQVAAIEAEYDTITRDFDAFYTDLTEQKEKLERQSRAYMQAIAQKMDLQVDIL